MESSSDSEFSRADISGWFKNKLSCQTVCIEVGAYSKNVWNLSSWKRGHSRIIWALSSRRKPHKRHVGLRLGSILNRWYLRKLWPVRCLIHWPRSCLPKCRSSFESLKLGAGKNNLVCRQESDCSHLAIHFSVVYWRTTALTVDAGNGKMGSGPSTTRLEASFASMSASSLP